MKPETSREQRCWLNGWDAGYLSATTEIIKDIALRNKEWMKEARHQKEIGKV